LTARTGPENSKINWNRGCGCWSVDDSYNRLIVDRVECQHHVTSFFNLLNFLPSGAGKRQLPRNAGHPRKVPFLNMILRASASNFRQENGKVIRHVCRQFIALRQQQHGPYTEP
jgi:hypothetical protein